jgi:cytochrome P450
MLGIPEKDGDLFIKWIHGILELGIKDDDALMQAVREMTGYFAAQIEQRKKQPTDDLITTLMMAKGKDGNPLADEHVLGSLRLLLIAGIDTTWSAIGSSLWHLARTPADRERLIAEPEIIPLAVEETLRYYTIIFGDGRKVTRDVEFHGVQLKKGDMVYALVSGANRDPRHWERADEFVIDRKKNNHFGFASGPHRCLGMHLARREMAIAVQEWLAVMPHFELDSDATLQERGGGAMMALETLPLRWEVSS